MKFLDLDIGENWMRGISVRDLRGKFLNPKDLEGIYLNNPLKNVRKRVLLFVNSEHRLSNSNWITIYPALGGSKNNTNTSNHSSRKFFKYTTACINIKHKETVITTNNTVIINELGVQLYNLVSKK